MPDVIGNPQNGPRCELSLRYRAVPGSEAALHLYSAMKIWRKVSRIVETDTITTFRDGSWCCKGRPATADAGCPRPRTASGDHDRSVDINTAAISIKT